MNKKLNPTVLMATIMIAGISALTPIDLATTAHTTIAGAGSALGTPGSGTVSGDIDDIQNMVDNLVQTGSCEQVVGAVDPDSECIDVSRNGILYIVVDTTLTATTGLKIQVDNVDACLLDVAIEQGDSPFLCVLPVTAGEIVTLIDAANDDSTGTADTIAVNSPVDPT